jgi:hypothetical protein
VPVLSTPLTHANQTAQSGELFSDVEFLFDARFSGEWVANSLVDSLSAVDVAAPTVVTRWQPTSLASLLDQPLPVVLNSYYSRCHPSHPFLPPRPLLQHLLSSKPLSFLESAIRYSTACFVPRQTTHFHIPDCIVNEVIATYSYDKYAGIQTPFMLQTLLILAIASGTQGHTERAATLMSHVRELALRLGLNGAEFAVVYGEGNPLLEDSWRRTWWEAYVIDIMQNGIHSREAPLDEVEIDVLVPLGTWEGNGVSSLVFPPSASRQ